MTRWQTSVSFLATPVGTDETIEISQLVVFQTDLIYTDETSSDYQRLAWESARRVRPEWVPPGHVIGTVRPPAGLYWVTSPIIKLSHVYREVD